MDVSLSDSDIGKYIKNIVQYENLHRLNAEQLVNMLPLVILYQPNKNDPDMGHWTLLHRVPGSIEFFDSYGFRPDEEFKVIGYQQPHYIAKMLLKLMPLNKISYSPYKFQNMNDNITTCGRWVIVRNMFGSYDIDKFSRAIMEVSTALNITPDELVSRIT
jgi:hypothetical protein